MRLSLLAIALLVAVACEVTPATPTPTPTPTLVESLTALLPQVALLEDEQERTGVYPCQIALGLFYQITDIIALHPEAGGEGTSLRQAMGLLVLQILQEECLAVPPDG